MTSKRPPPYLAFGSGSISYDCAPCGRCCRGLGIADLPDHLRTSPALSRLAPFVADHRNDVPLTTLFTYADGCRYLAEENLCTLHRDEGAAAKPLICRLFPFSKLIDMQGLWIVMPHPLCPWNASAAGDGGSVSDHAALLTELGDGLLDRIQPQPLTPRTAMPVADRQRLEESVRDALSLSMPVSEALAAAAEAQRAAGVPTLPLPSDPELLLDLLRCAGEPPPMSDANQRLYVAALPALRIQLLPHTPIEAVPAALAAFELWLRSLAELREATLTGEDLMSFVERIAPLLRILAMAEQPVPDLSMIDEPPEALEPLLESLTQHSYDSLGLALLATLRPVERGALPQLLAIAECL